MKAATARKRSVASLRPGARDAGRRAGAKPAASGSKAVHRAASHPTADWNADKSFGLRTGEMDKLVRDFESQCSIAELRRELEESQASMQRSEAILRRAASDFYTHFS
jgi:hypothetical protein